jgi:hypothetical protein
LVQLLVTIGAQFDSPDEQTALQFAKWPTSGASTRDSRGAAQARRLSSWYADWLIDTIDLSKGGMSLEPNPE